MKPNQLEDRLVRFAAEVILAYNQIDSSFAVEHLGKQLIRSATSSALNYGEARSAESNRDFLHKMKLSLKELRECMVNLKILKESSLMNESQRLEKMTSECNELISIFVASIKTATNKLKA